MFQFPRCPRPTYVFSRPYPGITLGGLPHSDISGSTLARSSPKHFVACHVLHRLLAPRHPPHALSSLTYVFTRLARSWPDTRSAFGNFPRRNRIASSLRFLSSLVVRVQCTDTRLAGSFGWARRSAHAFRADAAFQRRRHGVSDYPLTDEHDPCRAQRSEDGFFWLGISHTIRGWPGPREERRLL